MLVIANPMVASVELIITVGSEGYDKTLSCWNCFSGWNKEQLLMPGQDVHRKPEPSSPLSSSKPSPRGVIDGSFAGEIAPKNPPFTISHPQRVPEQFQTNRCAGFHETYLHSDIFCISLYWPLLARKSDSESSC